MPREIEIYVRAAGQAFAEQLRLETDHWQPNTGPEDLGRWAALPVLRVPTHPEADSVCVKAFPSCALEELPLMQRHVFGSRKWARSYDGRSSSVETFFATVKDASREGVWRGRIRVTGIIKTGLCVALAVASANPRLALAFSPERAAQPPRRRRLGRPTQQRKLTYRQVIEDAAASHVLLKT